MQKRSTSRGRTPEAQRRALAVTAANPVRSGQTLAVSPAQAGSGEVTLGGHADRGLTLAAFYDTGVLERLRLEVRVRLIVDLALSLAWLHANPRLMAAHSHLLIAPSTVVIGLDGVARVDVRAARKRTGESAAAESQYLAPELLGTTASGDHRSDIFSLGMIAWEALAGHRLLEQAIVPQHRQGSPSAEGALSELPATLAGPSRSDASVPRNAPARAASKSSQHRLQLAPRLTLPVDGEWALPALELALQAICLDVNARPQDSRSLVARLEALDAKRLASHQEIAEVVQGISAAATLCVAQPALPSPDAMCQEVLLDARGSARASCCIEAPSCAQPPPKAPAPAVVAPAALPSPRPESSLAAAASAARNTVVLHERAAGPTQRWWFAVAVACLALLGLCAGYVASMLTQR